MKSEPAVIIGAVVAAVDAIIALVAFWAGWDGETTALVVGVVTALSSVAGASHSRVTLLLAGSPSTLATPSISLSSFLMLITQ